ISSSEASSSTSASQMLLDNECSKWWDMAAAVGVSAAHAASRSSRCGAKDAHLPLQELTGRQWVALNIADSKKCYDNFRLHPLAFRSLHDTLVEKHGLKSTRQCDSIEALGMFLWACGTRQCQRQICARFCRSQDTVSRKFGEVLDAMIKFAKSHRWNPFPVSVLENVRDDFINRKGFTSQNVLAICDMDMWFTFVATGKKGAAHDMAVFREAMNTAEHFPHPPPGKYYPVDSGYPLREGYMAPIARQGPENLNEIFNYHHSSLRNVVERSFGVLKNKWQILQGVPLYPMDKQSKIIVACFALHNFGLDYNEAGMELDAMYGKMYLHSTGEGNNMTSDWLDATSNDDIGAIRDWIVAGLYGLASL
ncbi:hypothetical protein U9M48_002040, partial [Paspalum notatum var. saurae]